MEKIKKEFLEFTSLKNLNSLFFQIHHGYVVYDFKTVDEGYHDQGGLRHIQPLAPSVKDLNK